MYQFQYNNAAALIEIAQNRGKRISDIAIAHEAERDEVDTSVIVDKMLVSLSVMQTNIADGVRSQLPSIGGLIGKNAKLMHAYAQKGETLSGSLQSSATAYALAITEENARMKRIVACPTAGASGVVPGCVIAYCQQKGLTEKHMSSALFNASAIGIVIALGASLSGAQSGCQAEVGAASAMAASALTELRGGTVQACANAAALALKNLLGLVCDPVAGLVEVPCSKRNAIGVAGAIAAADMSLAGIKSVIPLDEVISAMNRIGQSLPYELKETAKGGVAATATGKAIKKQIRKRSADILYDS